VGGGREGETAGGRVCAAVKAEVEKPKAYTIKLLHQLITPGCMQ
jgi:hypothetical protein